jgi:NAD-dependent SIR2 family protein deacetylase
MSSSAQSAGIDTHFESLVALLGRTERLVVLSGAGCSTDSGIPDYRDHRGAWKRTPPMYFQEFMGSHAARQRYWARALIGWRQMRDVQPNVAHRVLAEWEQAGRLSALITQNVDGLHQRAGSRAVIDLHGRVDRVECMQCHAATPRSEVQREMEMRNAHWARQDAAMGPDGDALLEADFGTFAVPECQDCGGVLKPAVVFFGESVPKQRVIDAFATLARADALLVVGSSLMVFSGYRFVRFARERGIATAILNRGRTRADGEVSLKIEGSCSAVLAQLHERLFGVGKRVG